MRPRSHHRPPARRIQRSTNQPFFQPATARSERHSESSFFTSAPNPIQTKLTVNQPGDAHEREADAVSDQVMRMRHGDAPIVQRMPLTPVNNIMRKCSACEEKEKEGVQRKDNGGGNASGKAAPSIVSNVLASGGGQPMERGTKQFMESRFGQDFSQVRIHTDARAAESASAIQARAYTSGRNVVFGSGEYQPESQDGRRLLAHELVHVGQQGGNNIKKSELMNPSRTYIQRKSAGGCVGKKWKYDIDGCSDPTGITKVTKALGLFDKDNPTGGVNTQFSNESETGACDLHDKCYQTCGSKQEDCDKAMLKSMLTTCSVAKVDPTEIRKKCAIRALEYYTLLKNVGSFAYSSRQKEVCECQAGGKKFEGMRFLDGSSMDSKGTFHSGKVKD